MNKTTQDIPLRKYLLAAALITGLACFTATASAEAQEKSSRAKRPAAKAEPELPAVEPLDLSFDDPADKIRGDVTVKLKIKLPDNDQNTRGLVVRLVGITVLNGKAKMTEWSYFGQTEITRSIGRANAVVASVSREGRQGAPLRQSEYKIWHAELPADANPGQTDMNQPVTLDWTIEMVPVGKPPTPTKKSEPAPQPAGPAAPVDTTTVEKLEGGVLAQNLKFDLLLKGSVFTIHALWLDPETGEARTAAFDSMEEVKTGLAARRVTNAMIIRANETDNDPNPVTRLKVVSKGQRRTVGLTVLNFWTTTPGDGLLITQRTSSPLSDFVRATPAPTDMKLYRKLVPFNANDIGDFSDANKSERGGAIIFGKLKDRYFKLLLQELALNRSPEKEPFVLTARILIQPDGSPNLPGE